MLRSGIVALLLTLGVAGRAEAGWGLRNSFGQGIYLAQPHITEHVTITNPDGSKTETDKLSPGCGGQLCYDGNRRQPIDFEVMPYYGFGLLSLDLGVVFNLESRNDLGFNFRFRPGVRIFPFLGLFVRGFLDLNIAQINANLHTPTSGTLQASFEGSLGLAVGYQFKLGPWGVFAEAGLSPRLWGQGTFNMPFEIRLGMLLEP